MGWGVENEPTQGGFGFLGEGAQNRNFLGPRIFFKKYIENVHFRGYSFLDVYACKWKKIFGDGRLIRGVRKKVFMQESIH